MRKRTLLKNFKAMDNFTKTNMKTVDEILAELPSSTPEEMKDLLITLQQSLLIGRSLIIALDRHPILKRIILNTSK